MNSISVGTHRTHRALLRLLALLLLLASLLTFKGVTLAAPPAAPALKQDVPSCKNHRQVKTWRADKLEHEGFLRVVNGSGELTFNDGDLGLFLNPSSSQTLSTARVQDYLPPDQDLKRCWVATAKQDIVVDLDQRYTTPAMFGVTQNNLLWTAPPRTAQGQTYSAFGLTRNGAFGPPQTFILMTENLNFPSFQSTFLRIVPLRVVAPWLNELEWFHVHMVIGVDSAEISVSQNGQTATVSAVLPQPPAPLGLELSADNELVPGVLVPVAARTGVIIGDLDVEYDHAR
jgi:hypothetical protein